jgi:hypothetical protein
MRIEQELLLAMADFRSHPSLLATELAPPFARAFGAQRILRVK